MSTLIFANHVLAFELGAGPEYYKTYKDEEKKLATQLGCDASPDSIHGAINKGKFTSDQRTQIIQSLETINTNRKKQAEKYPDQDQGHKNAITKIDESLQRLKQKQQQEDDRHKNTNTGLESGKPFEPVFGRR